jgi:hypothetical protein
MKPDGGHIVYLLYTCRIFHYLVKRKLWKEMYDIKSTFDSDTSTSNVSNFRKNSERDIITNVLRYSSKVPDIFALV